ncbi:twin-arginine translocase subunit TatC [Candidatus Saccharibacteria bacterium]|nr:MAG: twin-arginine translocase subunit TatC [Candidatus Saccharibacteria bacterium]
MAAAKKAAGKQSLTLHDHIKELRNRFFVVAIIFIVVSAVAYNYKDTLLYYLLKPLNGEKLVYLNPAGGFSFIFQVTMYVGVAVAVPFLVYNLYKFVAPALPENARKHSVGVMISSLLLLCVGVGFGYIFAIPGALNFLNNFGDGYIMPNLTADSYLNFILAYTAGLGILFQLPLVLLLIHWAHPLKPSGLFKFERYMILVAFVGAAMITPTPDVMNQTIIALPIIIMYQMGVVAVCISVFRAKRRALPPKLSRAERKAQKKAEQGARHARPVVRPELPAIPRASLANESMPTPVRVQPSRPRYRPDIVAPIKNPKKVVPVMAPTPITVEKHALPQLSQTRKSMDIMIAAAVPSGVQRGAIPRTSRPVQHRTPVLQVPQRQRGVISSVDGISVI